MAAGDTNSLGATGFSATLECGFVVEIIDGTALWLQTFQVHNLPQPYGQCEEFNPVSVSECKQRCKTEYVVKTCGCRDVYMEPIDYKNGF